MKISNAQKLVINAEDHTAKAELAKLNQLQKPNNSDILISISDIEDHPDNYEIYGDIDTTDIDESIINNGILQAVIVCKGSEKRYRLLAGHRRVSSCRKDFVQKAYEQLHNGETITKIKATFKGELTENEQMRILLETNQIRQKTFFMKVQESMKEKMVLARELEERKKLGDKVEEKMIANDVVGKKYFGVGKDTYVIIIKIYELLKNDNAHSTLKHLNESIVSGFKIEWQKIYDKLANKPEKKRLGAGKSHAETLDFLPRLQELNFEIKRISQEDEAERAYLYFSKMARESKDLLKSFRNG